MSIWSFIIPAAIEATASIGVSLYQAKQQGKDAAKIRDIETKRRVNSEKARLSSEARQEAVLRKKARIDRGMQINAMVNQGVSAYKGTSSVATNTAAASNAELEGTVAYLDAGSAAASVASGLDQESIDQTYDANSGYGDVVAGAVIGLGGVAAAGLESDIGQDWLKSKGI